MIIKYIEGDKDIPSGYYYQKDNVFYSLEDLINNKDKEIERLKEELKQAKEIALNAHKYASEMEDKYISANNIINELEKDLEEKIDEDRLNILSNSHWKYVLDKLQELKGSE